MITPRRVLQVVGGLDHGGTEAWLSALVRGIDPRQIALDFAVHSPIEGALEPAIRQAGGTVLRCLAPHRPLAYARNLRWILRERGPYAAVHTHVHDFSGFVLRLAAHAGVDLRIAHAHADTTEIDAQAPPLRRAYQQLGRFWIRRCATHGFAVGPGAGRTMFGSHWRTDPRVEFLPCGIDPAAFSTPCDPATIRRALGLPLDAPVLGHVGRFVAVKNHAFLVEIAARAMRGDPGLRLLLVGDGPLRPQVEAHIGGLGLRDRTVFTGARNDAPDLMRGAMDAFVFPSRAEGLGRVLIEAQAAGLPVVCSDRVPEEAVLDEQRVRRLALEDPIEHWVEAVSAAARKAHGRRPQPVDVTGTAFDLRTGRERLVRLYESAPARS